MNIARSLGDAVIIPPERYSPRWWVSRSVPAAATTAEFIMAVATLLRHTELRQTENLLTTARLLDRFVEYTHIDPAITLAVLAITHIGGNRIMTLLETLLKPLLEAQREAGEEIGEARGEARGKAQADAAFEAWKARQRAAGVRFVVDDEQPKGRDTADR